MLGCECTPWHGIAYHVPCICARRCAVPCQLEASWLAGAAGRDSRGTAGLPGGNANAESGQEEKLQQHAQVLRILIAQPARQRRGSGGEAPGGAQAGRRQRQC